MIKKVIAIMFVLALVVGHNSISAQRVRIFENVEQDLAQRNTKFGPNKQHYTHLFLFAGQALGESSDSLPINYVGSGSFGLGFRYKHKLARWWAHGFDLAYNYQSYRIKQSDEKRFINDEQYEKEILNMQQVQTSYFWRITIGRTGNYLGKYVDFGVFGAWTFANTHKWVQKNDEFNANRMVVKTKGVDHIESIEYGALARIGFNKLAFFGKYRLSELLKPQGNYQPKLPPLTIGLELKI